MFNCYSCGSENFTSQLVNETFEIEGKLILVENIPAQVCSRCGEITFSGETAEKVRLIVQGETKPIKSIKVDVFAYQR
ncbi:YgiT-type zinc finger protein [Cyanothece sp. BG0011]|uniref:YgiT-type zinc finger protein n=1 Tax=Cyanothece sp. BG0011 TaxID=2082950 RepID=UPI000D1E55E2|nr:YgiT-type zinc finger protein [Cyanothece sp. BG0011]